MMTNELIPYSPWPDVIWLCVLIAPIVYAVFFL